METQGSKPTALDQTITPPYEPGHRSVKRSGNKLLISLLVVLVLTLIGGSYYLGLRSGQGQTANDVNASLDSSSLSSAPTPDQKINDEIGSTTFSFMTASDKTYIKSSTNLTDPIVKFHSNDLRQTTKVYTEQLNHYPEPVLVDESDIPTGRWSDLITIPINNDTHAKSLLVSDDLFSFKNIPNSNNFLFVITLVRSIGESDSGPWSNSLNQKTIYYYDSTATEKLKEIQSFHKDYSIPNSDYTFPKIDSISQDGKYASVLLFGCWGCGGHQPETLLINLETFQTKNIKKVSHFEWQDNGNYTYKDYVVIECPEPTPGECSQDKTTLPQKTGTM